MAGAAMPERKRAFRRMAVQAYEKDINAWANEQARLLRARRFELLDVEHIAGEIEDVGKCE